jgi:hypothetical protein
MLINVNLLRHRSAQTSILINHQVATLSALSTPFRHHLGKQWILNGKRLILANGRAHTKFCSAGL